MLIAEVNLNAKLFATCLREAPSGSSPGPGGVHQRDAEGVSGRHRTLHFFTSAAEDFVRSTVLDCIFKAFTIRRRPRNLMGASEGSQPARHFVDWSTRAETDCAARVVNDDPEMTVLSMDGIGACDHVYRASILAKMHEVPSLRPLLLFVRQTYAWESRRIGGLMRTGHRIRQHEGGKQGDPLMPLLFSLAIHNALAEVKAHLNEGERLFAFLDDIYVLAKPGRIREIYNLLGERLFARSGIQLHTGKTRTWNGAGAPPPRMEVLGLDVWSCSGIKILGTPVGDDEFVRKLSEECISK